MVGKTWKRTHRLCWALLPVTFVVTFTTLWLTSLDPSTWLNIFYPSEFKLDVHAAPIDCYEETARNHIEDIVKYPPSQENGVFFHETSCASADLGDIVFTPRQACAVESAALTNPEAEINVLFLSPISLQNITETKNKAVQALLTYSNVKFKHASLPEFVKGTPLEGWYQSGALKKSFWPTSHASDVMRYLTLWKYSGTYLDLDVVMLKSINELRNFAGAESPRSLGAGIINLDSSETGRSMADAFLRELHRSFSGSDWGANGPGVITRVLERICNVRKVQDMTQDRCGGFTIHPPATFYPVSFREWRDYFDEAKSESTLKLHEDSYCAHLSNKFSVHEKVKVGSKQAYGILAKQYCPKVFATCSEVF